MLANVITRVIHFFLDFAIAYEIETEYGLAVGIATFFVLDSLSSICFKLNMMKNNLKEMENHD